MPLAIEYMNRARVLVVKVYGQIAIPELRDAPEKIAVHGCYFAGVPLLIELGEWPSARLAADLQKLKTSLLENFPRSRVAVALDASVPRPSEPSSDSEFSAFGSRSEALAWLTAEPGQ
jgi:hypothetical protein